MRKTRMSFSQEYIDHAWLELCIPSIPGPNGTKLPKMDNRHLHIWPRHSFMMIALPNSDNSFTVTLFMPFQNFNEIKTEAELISFFKSTFPDALDLIGTESLVESFFKNTRGSLVSIKCSPFHYKNKAVIIGDSAHAMVPFYGQGMNCGFQDVEVLVGILEKRLKSGHSLQSALEEYTETRVKDAHAICDLALYNYIEMRSSVTSYSYRIMKAFEGIVHRIMPTVVVPLYTMVSFSTIPYSQVVEQNKRQTFWIKLGLVGSVGGITAGLIGLGLFAFKRFQ